MLLTLRWSIILYRAINCTPRTPYYKYVEYSNLKVVKDAVENESLVLVLEVWGCDGRTGRQNQLQNRTERFLITRTGICEGKTINGNGSEELDHTADSHILCSQESGV